MADKQAKEKKPKSGIVVGLNKGHEVTARETRPKPSRRKGVRYNQIDTYFCSYVKEVCVLVEYKDNETKILIK
jgi:large subunit ribosomal protein L36e